MYDGVLLFLRMQIHSYILFVLNIYLPFFVKHTYRHTHVVLPSPRNGEYAKPIHRAYIVVLIVLTSRDVMAFQVGAHFAQVMVFQYINDATDKVRETLSLGMASKLTWGAVIYIGCGPQDASGK